MQMWSICAVMQKQRIPFSMLQSVTADSESTQESIFRFPLLLKMRGASCVHQQHCTEYSLSYYKLVGNLFHRN